MLALTGSYLAIAYADQCYQGIVNGIELCTGVLVPSLFIFMVLTAYIIESPAAAVLSRPLNPLIGRSSRLPDEATCVIFLSLLGGYPIGAGCTALLYRSGRMSESEAVKTAYIAVSSGPGFLINYVGRSLLGSIESGGILLFAQAVSLIATAFIVGRTVHSEPPAIRPCGDAKSGTLVGAVRSASYAVFAMCGMVLVFAAVIEILPLFLSEDVSRVVSAGLEITVGCQQISHLYPLYITAFFIGFGGLAVHFQIFAILKDIPVKKTLFFLFRIIEGIITAAVTYIYLMISPMESTVFNSIDVPVSAATSATYIGSGALIMLSLLFIGSLGKIRRQ